MVDFVFDAFTAFNALVFLLRRAVMLLIGALFIGYWVSWRLKSVRVKGRIVAIKSTGARRSDAEWQEQYAKDEAGEKVSAKKPTGFFAGFGPDFKEAPFRTVFAYLAVMLLGLVPFAFFGFGSYMVYDYVSLKSIGHKAQARVVDIETSYDSDSGTTYAPVLSFRDANGRIQRHKDRISTGSSKYKKGDVLTVYYDPDKPGRFMIDSFWRYMALALIFMTVGGGIIGWVVWHAYLQATGRVRKKKSKPDAARRKVEAIKRQHYLNQKYTPVYEFHTPGGDTVRADGADDANNWIANILPGKAVKLMVIPPKDGKPLKVKKPGRALFLLGLVFVLPGLFMGKMALAQIELNAGLVAVLLAGMGFAAYKLKGIIRPRSKWLSREEFMKDVKTFKAEVIKSGGYEMTPAEIRERLRMFDRNALFAVPVVLFFGCALLFGGYQIFRDVNDLSGKAMVAQGHVVDLRSRSGSDGGYTYYPVVAYETLDGKAVRFEGKTGSNPPMNKVGDRLMVLYDPENPQKAMVDHGWMNWLLPLGLGLCGLLMVFYALKMLAGIVARASRR